ncbi:mechanosensitive ion channel [Arcobacteraceae bacterium]|nr:mechanosensitive ion channel [Arcobacteraceae bacterium]
MENITNTLTPYAINIILGIAIFLIGKYLSKILTKNFKIFLDKSNVNETLKVFLGNVIYSLFLIIVTLAALNKIGIQTTSFIALLGAFGLAIGLAFQSTLSNISAGVMIVIFRPFNIGDFIEAVGIAGTVEEINLFNTIFKTPDNKVIIVANSNVIVGNIVNYSKKDTRRVDFLFSIGYGDYLKLAKETLLNIVNQDSRVLQDPVPLVAVKELTNSSVDLVVRVWVKSKDYWNVNFETIEKVKLTFDEKGISIPYPQMDIHTNKIK